MPYNIAQFKRSQLNSYSSDVTYTQGLAVNENSIINFYDPCLNLTGSDIVSSLYSYYLKFTVAQRTDSVQDFTVKLNNSEVELDNDEELRSFSVAEGTESTSFELIFNPNNNYNQVIFELSRLALDFTMDNGDGTSGRIMDVTIEEFTLIRNVVDTLKTLYDGLTTLTKIGIQGPPGMLFCIDGEEIRIGRSGIYELYTDTVDVSYIGFVIKDSTFTQDGQDFFIMDFKY